MLFLIATVLSGKAVLPQAHATDIYLTALGMPLTLVYLAGLLFRPERRTARLGIDSMIVLALYAIGIADGDGRTFDVPWAVRTLHLTTG